MRTKIEWRFSAYLFGHNNIMNGFFLTKWGHNQYKNTFDFQIYLIYFQYV